MKKAMDIMKDMMNTKQYQKNIEIMELFSLYRSYTGHELPKAKLMKDIGLSSYEYEYIVAGSTKISPKIYDIVIKYLKFECMFVGPKYTFMSSMTVSHKYKGIFNELPKYIINGFNNIISSIGSQRKDKRISESKKTMSYKHAINL